MPAPRILTNMGFWQSTTWSERTASIFPDHGRGDDTVGLHPLREAMLLFRQRKGYDVVHTMGVRESLIYGLLCALSGKASRQIMAEVFIDEAKPGSLLWRTKTWLQRWVARRSIGIITNSEAEIPLVAERFAISTSRLRFVPLNSGLVPEQGKPPTSSLVFSAGRSLRDYPTLLRAAEAIAAPIEIVCGEDDLPDQALPFNVKLYRELARAEYLDHLRKARVVALPLQESVRPTGQVVLLESMALGKPVVVTRNLGTVDYVRDGENALLVPAGDHQSLASAVQRLLNDDALARQLGNQARADIAEHYDIEAHARLRIKAIEELWQEGIEAGA